MSEPTLNKDDFWKLIQEAHTSKDQTDDEFLDTLQAALVKLGADNILRFQEIMNEYENLAYVPGLWEAANVIQDGCSDDGFTDFRAWLMAQGKDIYLAALADPDSLAELDLSCDRNTSRSILCRLERFFYVPYHVYQDLGRNDIYRDARTLPEDIVRDIRSEIHYAPGIETPKRTSEELEAALPRLCAKSGQAQEPEWAEHIYYEDMNWGCEWATKAAAPQSELKL